MKNPDVRVALFGALALVAVGFPTSEATTLSKGIELRLSLPPTGKTWQLPAPGRAWSQPDGQAIQAPCAPGHVRDVMWAPGGDYLAIQIDDGNRVSSCLYSMKGATEGRGDARLTMHDIVCHKVQAGQGGQGSAKPLEWGEWSQSASDRSSAEFELSWAPSYITNASGPFVFTLKQPGEPFRLCGYNDLAFNPARSRSLYLDGRGLDVRDGDPGYRQASWRPPERPGYSVSSGLTAISDRGTASCKGERLVHIPHPNCLYDKSMSCEDPIALTDPCASTAIEQGSSAADLQRAFDAYPAWDLVRAHDRLAFVRTIPGIKSQICVLKAPFGERSLSCYTPERDEQATSRLSPRWSADGRFLAYFEVTFKQAEGRGEAISDRESALAVIDFGSEPAIAHTLKGSLRSNTFHGPALFQAAGQSWAAVIVRENGRHNSVVALNLQTGESKSIPTGLVNIRSVDATVDKGTVRLALVAQAEAERSADANESGASYAYDKAYVITLPTDHFASAQ